MERVKTQILYIRFVYEILDLIILYIIFISLQVILIHTAGPAGRQHSIMIILYVFFNFFTNYGGNSITHITPQ